MRLFIEELEKRRSYGMAVTSAQTLDAAVSTSPDVGVTKAESFYGNPSSLLIREEFGLSHEPDRGIVITPAL